MKNLVLCADDYGQNIAISRGILSLLQKQRVSATSCMTNMPAWQKMAAPLQEYHNQIDIGLHFNLTEGEALSPSAQRYSASLTNLIMRAFLGKIKQSMIEEELKYQLDAFTQATGFLPDFIDGHQHIHHLPIVRDALLNVYQKYFLKQEAYIRISTNSLFKTMQQSFRCSKIFIIYLTGAWQLEKTLLKYHIPHNKTFSGIYDFSAKKPYHELFPIFLNEIEESGLIMCHPGFATEISLDPISTTRQEEFDYLKNSDFLTRCKLVRGKSVFFAKMIL